MYKLPMPKSMDETILISENKWVIEIMGDDISLVPLVKTWHRTLLK